MFRVMITIFFLSNSLFAESDKAVIYDLTTGNIDKFKQTILSGIAYNKGHYEGKLESLKVSVMIHGDAYKFFIKDLSSSPYAGDKKLQKLQGNLQKRLKSLASFYNVEFLICHSGVKHRKIKVTNLYPFVILTPNASIGLIDKQNEGFAYFPVR